ncbi:MAG: hypothetical protein ACE5KV_08475 [Thermoplasmata archaeon]
MEENLPSPFGLGEIPPLFEEGNKADTGGEYYTSQASSQDGKRHSVIEV